MSKPQTANIDKTLVFHGSNMFFVKRHKFFEVKETKEEVITINPLHNITRNYRPLILAGTRYLNRNKNVYMENVSGRMLLVGTNKKVENELIQRN